MSGTAPVAHPRTVVVNDLKVEIGVRRGAKVVLPGLTFDMGTGVHGLLGPNGAGKTTLIRVLATALPPSSGTVTLLGHSIDEPTNLRIIRQKLGYLPQSLAFHPGFTVREFVSYFAWLKECPDDAKANMVNRALRDVDLADVAGMRMRALSGGMLRRAGLAQALVNDPRLLLLDEPTAGMDPEQRVRFRKLMRERSASSTIILATHLVEDLVGICTRVTVLDGGRIAWDGTPDELASADRGAEAGFGAHDRESLGAVSAIEAGYSRVLHDYRNRVRDRKST